MSKKNVVAKVLKIYAVVNAALGLFSGLYWISQSRNSLGDFGIIFIGLCFVFSFGIYAFGEVIQLLQDIRDRVGETAQNGFADDELPSI